MTTTRFLDQPFGAYHQAEMPLVDDTIVQVGPGTPGGEYLRRFWHPIIHADDLKDLPVPIRILGEDLVVFRDGGGNIGLLERHCAHRGTSLEYGKIESRGIRCCYHGWLFDVDGEILETPAERPDGPYAGKLCQGAYPVHEYFGLVFAYMGPPDKKPPFPLYEPAESPAFSVGLGQPDGYAANYQPTNWLQMMDNTVDQGHESFLHARHSGAQFLDQNRRSIEELALIGELDWWETPIGIACHETRRLDDSIWVRSMELIVPNCVIVCRPPVLPPSYADGESEAYYPPYLIRWKVPIDDAETMNISLIFYYQDEPQGYVTAPTPAAVALYGERDYEQRQRYPGDYDAQVGQRPIANHGIEHLGATDRGVAMMRRMVREGIEAVQSGEDPKGIDRTHTGPIPVYSREMMFKIGPAPSAAEDKELLHKVSRDVFDRSCTAADR